MTFALDLTPWQLWTLVSCGGLCVTLACLAVGGRGEADDHECDDRDDAHAAAHAIGTPIPLFDRDRRLVEVMTRTPEGYRYAAPGAGRHDGDCRPRSIHPGV